MRAIYNVVGDYKFPFNSVSLEFSRHNYHHTLSSASASRALSLMYFTVVDCIELYYCELY